MHGPGNFDGPMLAYQPDSETEVTNSCFATVVAGKFREPTGNIFVGLASYTANQQDENRKCIRAKRVCLN